jgi:hypothetical protein
LSNALHYLFSISTATFLTWTPSPSQPEDAPHRADIDKIITSDGTLPLLLLLLLLLLLFVVIVVLLLLIVVVFSVAVILKIFVPQTDPKSIINDLLTFNL